MKNILRFCLVASLICASGAGAAFAQAPAPNEPLGIVVNAVSAQIGSSTATEGATIFSGDYLTTADNGILLVRIAGLSLELQASSSLHLYRAPYGAVAELNSGAVTYNTPGGAQNLVIVASDVRVTPVLNLPDFGRVSIEDQCNVAVQSQKGQADVHSGSESHLIEQGKAYRVRAENSISYRKYLSPDDSDYHNYHEHKPCGVLQSLKGRPPIAAGESKFLYLAIGTGIVITTIPIVKAFESPNRP